jgi:hypothetical protein
VSALALALAGVATLEGAGSFAGAGHGDLLVLAGVLSAAAYTIVARGIGDESDPLTVTACQFTTATILILPAVTFVWAAHVETGPSHVAARFWFAAMLTGLSRGEQILLLLPHMFAPRARRAFAIISELTAMTLSESAASSVPSSTRSSRSGVASPFSRRCRASLAELSASCRARCTPIVVGSVLLISLLS